MSSGPDANNQEQLLGARCRIHGIDFYSISRITNIGMRVHSRYCQSELLGILDNTP